MRLINSFVLVAISLPVASAQGQRATGKSNDAPVRVQRKAPPANIVDRYDFGAQIDALQGSPVSPLPPADQRSVGGAPAKGFQPKEDVELTATAREAVKVSEQWMAAENHPAAGPDGRVLYSYGAGLPTIVCAPLRICIIELQVGEKVIGEPQIGDSVRWNLGPAQYGSGDTATSLVILKPQSAGLDTNLVITTDRRAYYLRLLSKPEDYVARVAFAYPDDDQKKWRVHLAEQREAEQRTNRFRDSAVGTLNAESLRFNYRVKGGHDDIRPIRVFDDGSKTYIQMPAGVQHREAPVFVVLDAKGKGEMVNYRVKDHMYIVDRLFNRGQLVLGSGKKAQKVEISRERK
jgi:type IV secretion system protein VirB9